MTQEQQTLNDVMNEIHALPVEQRAEVLKIAGVFRQTVSDNALAMMALALIGAELACHNGESA